VRFSELDGRAVAIWGFGRETRSFARQLRRRLPGARLTLAVAEDEPTREAVAGVAERVIEPAQAAAALAPGDVVVRSPGVSIYGAELQALRVRGITVVTATGLWLAERAGRGVIGVTGTKGKSTTATILAHLIAASGARVELAGNIGRPALDLLDGPEPDWTVLELSSYQVADLDTGPEIAVVTNLFDEHVDWHRSAARYRADKLRLLGLAQVRVCVVPAGSPEIAAAVAGAQLRTFGDRAGWHVSGETIRHGAVARATLADLPLRGAHNAANLCAALEALQAADLVFADLPTALRGLTPLPHRLQTVHLADGVEWIDDSISTTPESALAALAAVPRRAIVLIAGGQDRDQRHDALAAALALRGAAVIGLPVTGDRLVAAARAAGIAADRAVTVADLPAAVRRARALAGPGTVVLLSPAAPSYNSYRNFEQRGGHFAALAAATHDPRSQ
jgi:UDP-N-acetylmuramoylalanine--D-glutamate ligase